MNTFKRISPYEITANPFSMIGNDWMLITAEKDGKVNTMTASWGGVGILWNKPVAYVFIRPQRYTKEFVDTNTHLSLSVLDGSFRSQLNYLGTVSGRNEPKIEKAGLTLRTEKDVPFFDEAQSVLICRKLYKQDIESHCFIDPSIEPVAYPNKDFHGLYICEIEKVLIRQ